MSKLELWYHSKPYLISQKWGIYNPAYIQFGFSKHNGEDTLIGKDRLLRAPHKLVVSEVGFNESAGNFIRLFSPERVQIADQECYLGIMFMHLERSLIKKGDILEIGSPVAVPGNTGFSTGPHTHTTYRRYSKQIWNKKYQLDLDSATDFTFDPTPYWNKFHAVDYGVVMSSYTRLITLLQSVLKK